MKNKDRIAISIDPNSRMPAFTTINLTTGKITNYGKLNLHPLSAWEKLIIPNDVLVMEKQYLAKDTKANVRSLITLVKSVGFIEGLAHLHNIEVVEYMPSTWQSKMLACGYKALRWERKKMSKLRASDELGIKINSDDISDSINLALYYYRMQKFNQQEE